MSATLPGCALAGKFLCFGLLARHTCAGGIQKKHSIQFDALHFNASLFKNTAMKLSRLYQPRNPQFWLLVVLNLLSTGISHVLRSHELPALITLLLAAFALGNFVIGIRIALNLMREPPDN